MSDPIDLSTFHSVADFEAEARRVLPEINYSRVAGGSGSNSTLVSNADAFDAWRIRRRVLRDMSGRTLSTTILGSPASLPLVIAPQNQQVALHPDAELATARAATATGVPMGVSMGANHSIEDIGAATDSPLWFQPYAVSDRAIMRPLVERAEAAGYSAICITVDAPVNGWRLADKRGPSVVPDGSGWPNMPPEFQPGAGRWLNTSEFDWEDLDWLVDTSALPVIVKGIMHPDDARLAAEAGASAVVVSNHGGRQLGEELATLDALPAIAEAVPDEIEVFVDGGVTRGTHIVIALALGARAVLIGRAISWGLAAGGAAGVERVIEVLRGEFDTALANTGATTPSELSREYIVPNPRAGRYG